MLKEGKLIYKAILRFPKKSREYIINSNCLLTISVGQPYHEGEKLSATVQSINKKQFKKCLIMVCDTLQKYSIRILDPTLNEKQAVDKSVEIGRRWVNNNNKIINKLDIPFEIKHWDILLQECIDEKKYKEINLCYKIDKYFKESVIKTANNFLSRMGRRSNIQLNIALELCIKYILEECAVMLLLAERDYSFDIYPKPRNEAMSYVHKYLLQQSPSDYLQPVSIKFKKRKNIIR